MLRNLQALVHKASLEVNTDSNCSKNWDGLEWKNEISIGRNLRVLYVVVQNLKKILLPFIHPQIINSAASNMIFDDTHFHIRNSQIEDR